MASDVLGFGLAPFGSSVFGFGSPAVSGSTTVPILYNPDNPFADCEKLTASGDYDLDDRGRTKGDSAISQRVYLALFTELGSAAQTDLGIEPMPKVINESTAELIKMNVEKALSTLIKERSIALLDVKTERFHSTGLLILVRWINLKTREIFTTNL